MTKQLLLLLLFIIPQLAVSQDTSLEDYDDYVLVPFNLSVWPGVSTGDMWAEEAGYKKIYNTGFAFSLVGMKAARLRGIDLALGFSIYKEGAQGLQASGLFNIVNGNVGGAQLAGGFNIVDGDIKGVQGSGVFNILNGDFKGAQGAGVFNIQNGNFKGVQWSGVFNIQNGDFKGVQFSDVFNIVNGDFDGVQGSTSFNILNGSFRGVQLSFINYARFFDSGLQIGFVNISDENYGVPIGLFSYVDDVPIGYQIGLDDSKFVTFGVRSGNDRWYNLITISRRVEGDVRYHSIGAGIGRKYYLGDNWGMDLGISASKLLDKNFKDNKWRDGNLGFISKISLLLRYELRFEGSLFFGPTINGWVSKTAKEDLTSSVITDEFKEDHYWRVWPGFVVGLEL